MTIHAEFEWLDGTIKSFNRFQSIYFSRGANMIGDFKVIMPDNDDALDILMGSNIYIYKDKQRIFGGRTQLRTIDEGTSITVSGVDFNGLLALKKCTYNSQIDVESSAMIKQLLQSFIRDSSETLPLFNIDYDKYIFTTTTSKHWQFTRNSVFDACVGVANTSTSQDGKIGYLFYVDPFLYVHLEPLGANKIDDIIPFTKISFGEDHRDIKNFVEYFGGKESTVPVIPDSWTDLGNAADWTLEVCSAGCQTTCQTGCESPNPCQICGQTANLQATCDLACQAPSSTGMIGGCDPTCQAACQFVCQLDCQICAESPPGGLVGI